MFILGNKVVLWFFCFVFNKQAFLKAEKGKAKQWKFTFHKRPFQRSASGQVESHARSRSTRRGSEQAFPRGPGGPWRQQDLGGQQLRCPQAACTRFIHYVLPFLLLPAAQARFNQPSSFTRNTE